MRILEKNCIGKKSEALCEDDLFVGEHFAAVIDGSTSKASRTYHPEMSNGKLASCIVKETIGKLPPDADLDCACRMLEDAIGGLYRQYGADWQDLSAHPENRITASVVICSAHRREVWMIGDCLCMSGGVLYTNEKPQEAVLAEQRSKELRRLLDKGHSVEELRADDLGRKLILPGIIESTKGQNKLFAVVDGFPIAREHVKVIKVEAGTEVIMASDGYPTICGTLQQTEMALAHIIANDPLLMTMHKATKGVSPGQTSFDDRTYLRCVL
ncbi:MAG: hypothetical protein HUK08_07610 [Bacteroidaceae bacterium]|nr:hypothetical protein [Bacteroidaceae bacterium]